MKHLFLVRGKLLASGVALSLSVVAPAIAQTVTVDPTGTADGTTVFTGLQEAINSFAAGGTNTGNAAPNVINVRSDHGPVTGKVIALTNDVVGTANPITVDQDLVIQGVDASLNPALAVFAGLPVGNSPEQNIRNNTFSAFVWRQPVNLTFKNMAFIPAENPLGNPISSFMLLKAPATAGVNVSVNLESCVFSANDGTGHPVTTTGLPEDDSKLDQAGVIGLYRILPSGGAAGIWAFSREERGDFNLNMKDTVFASVATLTGTNPRTEIFKGWMSGAPPNMINFIINVNEGCTFANIDGNIAQIGWGGMIRMKGTDAKPVVVRKLKNPNPPAAVWLYYSDSNQSVAGEFDHVHFYDIDIPVISEGGAAGDGSQSFLNHVNNCVFADCGNDAITLRSKNANYDTVTNLAKTEITVDHTVFHNVGSGGNPSGIYSTAALERPVNVTNSYFTDSDATMVGLNNNSLTSVWTVDTTVLSLTAPTALRDATFGPGTINLGPGVSNGAVSYVNTTDPFSPDFYKPSAAVKDWSVY